MNTKLSLTIIVALMLFFAPLQSQTSYNAIQDVILVNNKPYVVQLNTKGDILAFQKELKNSFAAINNIKRQEIQLDNIVDLESKAVMAKANLEENAFGESSSDSTVQNDEESSTMAVVDVSEQEGSEEVATLATKGGSAKTDEAQEDSPSGIDYAYDFAFDHRDAKLSYNSVNQLNQIAEVMLNNDNAKVSINSFFSESVDISKILSKNRANAIKDVLVLRGVDATRVLIQESNNKDWANNRVEVSVK